MRILSIIYFFTFVSAFLISCNVNDPKEQITLVIETDLQVDSILFSNRTYDKEYHIVPFSEKITIPLNTKLEDLYLIDFFISDSLIMHQLWLNGSDVKIVGKLSDYLEIDSVYGSDLYYHSLRFRKKLRNQKNNIDEFLLSELDQNKSSLFSIEIANQYFARNRSNNNALKRLLKIQRNQTDSIKSHLLSSFNQVEKILEVKRINIDEFVFIDVNGDKSGLNLSKDKRYLLDFWFVGCKPCIEQHRQIKTNISLLDSIGIEVIGISIDRDQSTWAKFVAKQEYQWKNYKEDFSSNHSLRDELLITHYPTYYFLDDEGNIITRSGSFSEFLTHIDQLDLKSANLGNTD